MAERRLSRDDVVVAVGGGAITDLVGFAAAVYLRGVALVQVPTSLVGQVDAAVGGKTGVNLLAGKNLVGAFYQPLGVLCDTSVLSTLATRDRLSGLGEVAKCWLLENRDVESLRASSLTELIEMAVNLKVALVAVDEREGGSRVLLNYGHTLATRWRSWRCAVDLTSCATARRWPLVWPSPRVSREPLIAWVTTSWSTTTRCCAPRARGTTTRSLRPGRTARGDDFR